MGCDENYHLADNPDRPTWMRREALCNMIRDGCVAHLYRLADNPDRPNWLRYGSVDALSAFAQCGGASVAVSAASISVGGESISLTALSVDLSSVGRAAAEALYEIANNPDRPDRMRRKAVEALVAGRWSRKCLALADNYERPDWMRELAMKGL